MKKDLANIPFLHTVTGVWFKREGESKSMNVREEFRDKEIFINSFIESLKQEERVVRGINVTRRFRRYQEVIELRKSAELTWHDTISCCRKHKADEMDDDERGVDKVFGIVTDAEKWYFMSCTLDEKGKPSFGLSKPISVPYNNNGDMQINVEKVLGHIAWLLKETQKPIKVSPNGGEQRVLKKHKPSCNLKNTQS
ncbi:15742_t:CDS:2 [Dentiscutata heterogama]|uniref:15742_t:CDS:1 n=1 Tax=Dentiscutata heterogama TaxID=1316150 RepID=A0ACA9LU05_9GLOM|nr:15742_t:CDS:2 [Dentiscutata heterogama]